MKKISKKAAHKKIQQYINNSTEDDNLIITESLCYYWWDYLNAAFFDGELIPPVRFELGNFHDAGWCTTFGKSAAKQRRVKLGLSSKITTQLTFIEVLAHEMVHQWQWEVRRESHKEMKHGKSFYSWTQELKESNIPLHRSIRM